MTDEGIVSSPADTPRDPEHARFGERVSALAEEARRARAVFEPPGEDADQATVQSRALEYARDGVGPVVALYIEARTGGRMVAFTEEEFQLLQETLNEWLSLYALCYGVEFETEFTIREAAELLMRTHSTLDTAQLLTCVPSRR